MARTTSPRFEISYVNTATRDEPADVPADIKRLVDAFENSTPMWLAGTAAARPAAGKSGRFYWATDTLELSYDNGSAWTTVGPQPTLLVPTGSILAYGGSAAPAGFLMADGASYATATYPALHGVIGYAYGGSGANFNVPNGKGKVLPGRDAAQTEFDTLGESGGAKTHALSLGELAAHSHTVNNHSHTMNHDHAIQVRADIFLAAPGIPVGSSGGAIADAGGGGASSPVKMFNGNTSGEAPGTNSQGSGTAHNNLQPYLVVNHIIKT